MGEESTLQKLFGVESVQQVGCVDEEGTDRTAEDAAGVVGVLLELALGTGHHAALDPQSGVGLAPLHIAPVGLGQVAHHAVGLHDFENFSCYDSRRLLVQSPSGRDKNVRVFQVFLQSVNLCLCVVSVVYEVDL